MVEKGGSDSHSPEATSRASHPGVSGSNLTADGSFFMQGVVLGAGLQLGPAITLTYKWNQSKAFVTH